MFRRKASIENCKVWYELNDGIMFRYCWWAQIKVKQNFIQWRINSWLLTLWWYIVCHSFFLNRCLLKSKLCISIILYIMCTYIYLNNKHWKLNIYVKLSFDAFTCFTTFLKKPVKLREQKLSQYSFIFTKSVDLVMWLFI